MKKLRTRLANFGLFAPKPSSVVITHHAMNPTTPVRALIISQPKSGTYLFAEIIQNLGIRHTHLHLSQHCSQAYDANYLLDGLHNPRKYDVHIELEEAVKLVRSGELAVCHLTHSHWKETCLKGFKKIVTVRELRSALRSYTRMVADERSTKLPYEIAKEIRKYGVVAFLEFDGGKQIELACRIADWIGRPDVVTYKMESLLANPGKTISHLSDFLDLGYDQEHDVLSEVRSKPTLTSGVAPREVEWDDSAEILFKRFGGREVNEKLGYTG